MIKNPWLYDLHPINEKRNKTLLIPKLISLHMIYRNHQFRKVYSSEGNNLFTTTS